MTQVLKTELTEIKQLCAESASKLEEALLVKVGQMDSTSRAEEKMAGVRGVMSLVAAQLRSVA